MEMRKLLMLGLVAAAATACLENDMMLPKEVASFERFEVSGQQSSAVSTAAQTVTVTMPAGTSDAALKSLTVIDLAYTANATTISPLLGIGSVVDLSDTLRVTLSNYRDYEWKIIAKIAPESGDGGGEEEDLSRQLYNMNFDGWTLSGKAWMPYGEGASDDQMLVWATSNKGTASLLGLNTTEPETDFVAVSGEGKKAVKLASQYMILKFAAGNLFTGEFCGLTGFSGADLAWGVPFTFRPEALCGYYCYQPVTIDYAQSPYKDMLGKMDTGRIQVILADWDKNPNSSVDEKGRFHVINSKDQFVDIENDPAIVGYGEMTFDSWMDAYEQFEIPISYRDTRNPSVVVIVASGSRYGDYFTGGDGTVLYVDDFSFKY